GPAASFAIELGYYEGGGGRSDSRFLSSVPAGSYALRLEGQWSRWTSPAQIEVTVSQGILRVRDIAIVLGAIVAGGLLFAVLPAWFASRRWAHSSPEGRTPSKRS